MINMLEKAFAKASTLSASAQEQLAEQLLEDLDGELKWDQTLSDSQDALEQLAKKALAEKRGGETIPKGFDEL